MYETLKNTIDSAIKNKKTSCKSYIKIDKYSSHNSKSLKNEVNQSLNRICEELKIKKNNVQINPVTGGNSNVAEVRIKLSY